MRCFIAIEFDDKTRNILAAVQKQLKDQGIKGNYTRIDNLHLTLKFLGEIDMPTYSDICDLIKKVSLNHKKFVLELDRLGKFDKGSKKIVWAGLSDNKNLLRLYKELESEIEGIMPIRKEKYYIPHITLIREANLLSNDVLNIEFPENLGHTFTASGISLMESTRVDGRLTYIRRAFESFAV
jgi:2'-5' RNA ligase